MSIQFTKKQLRVVQKKHLLEDALLSETQIAKECKVSRATVSTVRDLLDIPRKERALLPPAEGNVTAPVKGEFFRAYAERPNGDVASWSFRTKTLKNLKRVKCSRDEAQILVSLYDKNWKRKQYDVRTPVIGILSESSHSKVIRRKLTDSCGFTVIDFGGDVYPENNSADIIVCRVTGCSHRAYWDVKEVAKRGDKIVIFEDGTSNAISKVKEAVLGNLTQDQSQEAAEILDHADTSSKRHPAEKFIIDCVESLGIMCRPMGDGEVETDALQAWIEVISQQIKLPSSPPGVKTPKQLSDMAPGYYPSTLRWAFDKLAGEGMFPMIQLNLGMEKFTLVSFLTYKDFGQEYVNRLQDELRRLLDSIGIEMTVTEATPETKEPVAEAPVEVVSPSVPKTVSFEEEMCDLLLLVRSLMEEHGIETVDTKFIEAVGLTGSLVLPVVHLSTPGGHVACASEIAEQDSMVLASVSCPRCQATEQFKLLSWYEDNKAAN